ELLTALTFPSAVAGSNAPKVEAPMALRAIVERVAVQIASDRVDRALAARTGIEVWRVLGSVASLTEASSCRSSHAERPKLTSVSPARRRRIAQAAPIVVRTPSWTDALLRPPTHIGRRRFLIAHIRGLRGSRADGAGATKDHRATARRLS